MKKIVLSLLIIVGLFTITGCGNNEKQVLDNENPKDTVNDKKNEEKPINNNLSCQGKVDLMTDFIISYGAMTADNPKGSDDPKDWSIGFPGEYINKDIENSEVVFMYEKNKLSSIQGKNVYTKSFSNGITDEQISAMNGTLDGMTYKTYKKNNQVIIEYTLNSEFDLFKVFNAHYPTKNELKDFLEEKTVLVCN